LNKRYLYIIPVFLAIGFVLYSPGISAPRYGDDFSIVPEGNLKEDLVKIWTSPYIREMFYRPIDDTISTIIIYFFGWNTIPVHILILLFHIYFVSFIYYVIIKLGYSNTAAFTGAFFVLIAQVNVFAVGSNDTIGTTLSCCFSLTSLWLLYRAAYDCTGKFNLKLYLASLALFTLALFTKEASVTFFPLMAVLILVNDPFFRSINFSGFKKILLISLPFLLLFIIYYFIHSSIVPIQPSTGSDNYNFRLGLNVPKNIVMLLFSLFLPVSTVRTFEAIQIRDYKLLAAALILTILFAVFIFYGIRKTKKLKEAIVLLGFIIASFFPYVLMNHVNEHYTYYSMPFTALIIGMGISYVIEKPKGFQRTIFLLFFILIALVNTLSVIEKSFQMKETGERADFLFAEITPYLRQVPYNGALVMVNPQEKMLKYSVFRLPGFETMRYAQFYIYKLAGKNDFKIEIVEWSEMENWKRPDVLMLKLEGDKVIPVN